MKSSNLSYTMVYVCTLVYLKYTKNIQWCTYFNRLKIISILLTWIAMTELNWTWTDFIDIYIDFIGMNMNELSWTELNWTWISSVQSLIRVSLFATPWAAALQVSLSITKSWVYPNSCPLTQWCHLTILSSVVPFSSCLQSFPPSGSFQRSQFFASDGQNIGVSAWTSVLPMNIQTDFL